MIVSFQLYMLHMKSDLTHKKLHKEDYSSDNG